MQSDTEAPAREPETKPALHASRRAAWIVTGLLVAASAGAALWGVKSWRDSQAIAGVERSVGLPPRAPAAAPEQVVPVAPGSAPAPTVAAGQDRLPPLALPGQRAPDAVLRDLPEWVTAQVAPSGTPRPVATSGGSGDESTAPPTVQRRSDPARTQNRERERPSATFARCPGAGESGAVECRRAICAGAARKSAACTPYRE